MYQRVGTRFGTYNIRQVLGAGGMAAVYYAVDVTTQQPVALKILSSQLAEVPAFRQRFELEAQITARLAHPHIVPVVGYGAVDEALYLAMRYLSGGTLHDRFVLEGVVSLQATSRYLGQLASALDYAHSQGVIHRDLKLANVLLDEDSNVLLSDFGIARLVESSLHLTESGSVLGSPHYMSPEQNEGKPLDARSDLYSLAVMIYLMVTGQFPFHADTPVAIALQHVTKPPPLPTGLNPSLPSAVDPVLLKGLAKLPADRFNTAAEFAAAFNRAIGDCDTQTLLHLVDLSRSRPTPIRIPTPPSIVTDPTDATAPRLKPIPSASRTSRWRLAALPIMTVVLLFVLRYGLAQFNLPTGDNRPTIVTSRTAPATVQPATEQQGVIIILPTLTYSPAPVPTLSVIVKDLHQPVNVRSGPAKNYAVVGQMYAVDQPLVLARTGKPDGDGYYWFLVRTTRSPKMTGWVSSEAVELFPISSLMLQIPIAATIPPTPTASNTPRVTTFTPSAGIQKPNDLPATTEATP